MLCAYLTVAPPNNIDLVTGGAVERIFKLPHGQIHSYIPHTHLTSEKSSWEKDALLTGRRKVLSRKTCKS